MKKKFKYSAPKWSLIRKLEKLFNENLLYTVQDLIKLTGAKQTSLTTELSNIQHPKRCGIENHIELRKTISHIDNKKRYGRLTATKNYKPKK
jgi:hypothetical protein